MRLLKARPRFHCDFCHRTSTKEAMERHEKICWKNPNRNCKNCQNTGWQDNDPDEPCYYCRQIKPEWILGDAYFA